MRPVIGCRLVVDCTPPACGRGTGGGKRRTAKAGGTNTPTHAQEVPRTIRREGRRIAAGLPRGPRRLWPALAAVRLARARAVKGECDLTLDDLAAHAEGMPPPSPPAGLGRRKAQLAPRKRLPRSATSRRAFSTATATGRGSTRSTGWRRRRGLHPRHQRRPLPRAGPRPLQDVMTCIREKATLDEAGFRLEPNAERHLKAPAEMARLFDAGPPPSPPPARSPTPALLPRRARYEYPRESARRAHARRSNWSPDLGGRGAALRGGARPGRQHAPQGAGADRQARHRPLLPDRPRHRPLRPRGGHAADPLPGARLGRQLRRLLLPRHHRRGPRRPPSSCSSASSPRSASEPPTSTSTSSTSGARR